MHTSQYEENFWLEKIYDELFDSFKTTSNDLPVSLKMNLNGGISSNISNHTSFNKLISPIRFINTPYNNDIYPMLFALNK